MEGKMIKEMHVVQSLFYEAVCLNALSVLADGREKPEVLETMLDVEKYLANGASRFPEEHKKLILRVATKSGLPKDFAAVVERVRTFPLDPGLNMRGWEFRLMRDGRIGAFFHKGIEQTSSTSECLWRGMINIKLCLNVENGNHVYTPPIAVALFKQMIESGLPL